MYFFRVTKFLARLWAKSAKRSKARTRCNNAKSTESRSIMEQTEAFQAPYNVDIKDLATRSFNIDDEDPNVEFMASSNEVSLLKWLINIL